MVAVINLTGKILSTSNSGKFKILRHLKTREIEVEFINTGYRKIVNLGNAQKGSIKDPYAPNVFGIGHVGEGKYSYKNHSKIYRTWQNMLARCFVRSGGVPRTVCKRWLNFQKFASDVVKMPNHDSLGFDFDKDLRVLGNRHYSPKTCSFVPIAVSKLLSTVSRNKHDMSQGVTKNIYKGKRGTTVAYLARANINGGVLNIGTFSTEEEARNEYLKVRLKSIRRIAKKYAEFLHPDVYENLMNYPAERLVQYELQ